MNFAKCTVALLLALVAFTGNVFAAEVSRNGNVRDSVNALANCVSTSGGTSSACLGYGADGHLGYFGAPPGNPVPLDSSTAKEPPEIRAAAFLDQYAAAFGLYSPNTGLSLKRVTSQGGRTYVHLNQTYAGIPVFGAELVVQLQDDDSVSAVLSKIMTDTEALDAGALDLAPIVDEEAATAVALRASAESYLASSEGPQCSTEAEIADVEGRLKIDESPALYVYDPAVSGRTGQPSLVWKIAVNGEDVLTENDLTLIGARDGKIVLHESEIRDLLDREIWDFQNDPTLSEQYPRGILIQTEGQQKTGIQDADRAYDCLQYAYSFYQSENGRDSINGAGETLRVTVRTPGSTCGAFYKNDPPWVFTNPGTVAPDVIGHEMTHGVILQTAVLCAANMQGYAITESLCDTWGEFTDLKYETHTDDDMWLIADNTESCGEGVRDMADPSSFGHPDRMGSTNYYTGQSSTTYGHTNAGVGNKLCYLITAGGSFNGYTIAPLDSTLLTSIAYSADLYYECLTNLLVESVDYQYLYWALTQSMINLAADTSLPTAERQAFSNHCADLEKACRAVEIRPTQAFTVNGGNSEPLMQITNGGDFVLYAGTLSTQCSPASLAASSTVQEFLIKSGTTSLFKFRKDTGDAFLSGKLYTNKSGFTVPSGAFIIKDSGTPKAFVNRSQYTDTNVDAANPIPAGSLVLAGDLVSLVAVRPPAASWFLVNGGALTTTSYTVTLTWGSLRNPSEYKVAESSGFESATWQSYTTSQTITVSAGEGQKYLTLGVRNSLGEDTAGASITAVTPLVKSFSINSGASVTAARSVLLNNSYDYSPTHYRASENPDMSALPWVSYSTSPTFVLSSGNGVKTVYLETKNEIGTCGSPAEDTIELQE